MRGLAIFLVIVLLIVGKMASPLMYYLPQESGATACGRRVLVRTHILLSPCVRSAGTKSYTISSVLGADSQVVEGYYSCHIPTGVLAPERCAPRVSPLQQPYRH